MTTAAWLKNAKIESGYPPAQPMTQPRIHALIPAAGLSVRFGGTTLKQYAHLLGRPVLAHTLDTLVNHPRVSAVTVALADDDGIYEELVRPHFPRVSTTTGGDSRAQTVCNGLRHILQDDPEAQWVLVHDAARPCLPVAKLDALIEAGLRSKDGAILAIPVSDTIKRAGIESRIASTVNRDGLWRAQTPQMFRLAGLLHALEQVLQSGEQPTDEAAAMERLGARPLLVPGAQINIKITGPEDLKLAELLLRGFAHEPNQDSEHEDENRTGV